MNTKAAIFACNVTGLLGLAAALLLWKISGLTGLWIGLLGAAFWFGLGWYFRRQAQ